MIVDRTNPRPENERRDRSGSAGSRPGSQDPASAVNLGSNLDVPTNDRFDRIRRTFLLFSGGGILIALSAKREVSLIFTSQSAVLPLWLVMTLLLLVILYYWWAFDHQRRLIAARHKAGAGVQEVDDQISQIRGMIVQALQDVKTTDFTQVAAAVAPAKSLNLMLEEGKLESLVHLRIQDEEVDFELRSRADGPGGVHRAAGRLSRAIASDIRAHTAKIDRTADDLSNALVGAIYSLEITVDDTLRELVKIETKFNGIDRKITRLSEEFDIGARRYFTWWEVRIPQGLAVIAMLLATFNIQAETINQPILSEYLLPRAQTLASPPPAVAPSRTPPDAGLAADRPPPAPPK